MALSTQPYKGARDFYPDDKRFQKYLFNVMRTVAERFGYEEYDAPILEPLEIYTAKTGEEIVNEQTYTFEDRGGRKVVIRPEMTPTVSRMVAAKRQELAYPLRWYSIPNLWRYERPQRGRLREHWQLNVDIFGISGLEAEHEIIQVADALMQSFKAKRNMYTIRLNSRLFINHVFTNLLRVDATQASTLATLIDKRDKISNTAFNGQLESIFSPTQRESKIPEQLEQILSTQEIKLLPEAVRTHQSIQNLITLMEMLKENGIDNVVFDPGLMRGFDYYTDIVFEVYDTDPENNRSMFGGGRYDGLVGLFGVEPVPTVGFGMGDVTLTNFLTAHKLTPIQRVETDLYLVLIGNVYEQAQPIIASLREMGVNVAVDSTGRKPDKQIKTAEKKGVHYVLFIGEKELNDEQFNLKNLHSGVEETHSLQRVAGIVKDYRN